MDKKKRDQINDCLKGVKRGERDALVSLYDLISPTLRFIALKYLKNEQDAEDLEQDFKCNNFIISNVIIVNFLLHSLNGVTYGTISLMIHLLN